MMGTITINNAACSNPPAPVIVPYAHYIGVQASICNSTTFPLNWTYNTDTAEEIITAMSPNPYKGEEFVEYVEVVGYTSDNTNHKIMYNGAEIHAGLILRNNGSPFFEYGDLITRELTKATSVRTAVISVRFKYYHTVTLSNTSTITISFNCGSSATTTTTTQGVTSIEYGALYNWYAATDARKISSSDDWIVPSMDDFIELLNYIDTCDPYNYIAPIAGGKLKEIGTTYWDSPNTDATNEFGFNGVGAGSREMGYGGAFKYLKEYSTLWSTTKLIYEDVYAGMYLEYSSASSGIQYATPGSAQSIRLLYTGAGTPTSYTGNDGKGYLVVKIGNQYWLASNLNETKYRNDDWMTGFDGGVYTPISNENWVLLETEAMCYYNDDENNG